MWGAQTQRSIENFQIGDELEERMPIEIIKAIAIIKKTAAKVNMNHSLDSDIGNAIQLAADDIIKGQLDEHFPLIVWQTGSGTQTNMNVNEVICNRAKKILDISKISKNIHPNDHVNMSQSSNDTFPTAIHIAVAMNLNGKLIPSILKVIDSLKIFISKYGQIIKVGRTHLQDATPIKFGQEFSGYIKQLENSIERIKGSFPRLYQLAQGGTAVGTGINSPKDFDSDIAKEISLITDLPFVPAPNKFEALASNDTIVEVSSGLQCLSVSLHKIANDIRLMGSGPRCGLNELHLPENEPGSSIMPGKVNPTQCEALTMVCAQIFGNHNTVAFAGSMGHLELNVYKPLIAKNILSSIRLLSDACLSFSEKCLTGLSVNEDNVKSKLNSSLMLVTSLNKKIGYESKKLTNFY
jgi:fumarate hydratase, class II